MQDLAAWSAKTSADLHSPESFRALKRERDYALLGVMGFAGAWSRSGKRGAELAEYKAAIDAALRVELLAAREVHGDSLVMVSGATNLGVLERAYAVCAELEITAMGITPDRTLRYEVAQMDFLIPYGHRFGDESELFVELADSFLLIGGGEQSRRETLAASARGKPVVVVTGLGGADELGPDELPNARFSAYDSSS